MIHHVVVFTAAVLLLLLILTPPTSASMSVCHAFQHHQHGQDRPHYNVSGKRPSLSQQQHSSSATSNIAQTPLYSVQLLRQQEQRQTMTSKAYYTTTLLYGSMDPNVDPSTLVSAKDDTTQQLAFVGIMISVLAGCFGFVSIYDWFEVVLPTQIFEPFYTILPYVLSSTFIAAGLAHFSLEETFVAFVPPLGTWGGLWQIPAPFSQQFGLSYEQYHSFWSGIAEVVVSLSLIATTAGIVDLGGVPASLMFLLTLAVTPANIYMFTHNPDVPLIPPVTYPWGHGARALLQCALLAVFFKLAVHSAAA